MISAFINNRPNDRIGVVVFAGKAYTFAPLTFDHDWLRKQTARLYIGMVEDGTAIGDALAIAIARLKEGWKDKTEGRTRVGSFIVSADGRLPTTRAPSSRAPRRRWQREAGIQIYAVGAGTMGRVPAPVFDAQGHRTGTELQYTEIDPGCSRTWRTRRVACPTWRPTPALCAMPSTKSIARRPADFGAAPPMVTRELFGAFRFAGCDFAGARRVGANFRSSQRGCGNSLYAASPSKITPGQAADSSRVTIGGACASAVYASTRHQIDITQAALLLSARP